MSVGCSHWNYLQRARDWMSLVVRTSGDPRSLVTPVLNSIKSIDLDQPSFAIRTMSEVVDQSLSLRWFSPWLCHCSGIVTTTRDAGNLWRD